MLKKLILILIATVIMTGCIQMPAPIKKSHENQAQQNMIKRSLHNLGNTYRINSKLKAAKKGEKTVIAYLGSSVFASTGETDTSVAKISFEQIKNFLGNKENIHYLNYSIEETGSTLGNVMLNREILSKNPDIVFVEYALTDKSEQEYRESFESIIRSCLLSEKKPAVIIFINSKSDGVPKQDFMEQTGKYYNLPIINVANAVQPEITSGRMKSENFYADNTTLTKFGRDTLAQFIVNYIKQVQKKRNDDEYTVPVPMYPNSLCQNVKYIQAVNIQSDNDGSFVRKNSSKNKYFPNEIEYLTNTGNNPFIFTVEANSIYIIAPTNENRTDIAEIYINGKKHTEIVTQGNKTYDIPQVFKIYSGNSIQKIAVAIRLKENEEKTIDLTEVPDEKNNEVQNEDIATANSKLNQKPDEETAVKIVKPDFSFYGIGYTQNELPEIKKD